MTLLNDDLSGRQYLWYHFCQRQQVSYTIRLYNSSLYIYFFSLAHHSGDIYWTVSCVYTLSRITIGKARSWTIKRDQDPVSGRYKLCGIRYRTLFTPVMLHRFKIYRQKKMRLLFWPPNQFYMISSLLSQLTVSFSNRVCTMNRDGEVIIYWSDGMDRESKVWNELYIRCDWKCSRRK